MASPHVAGAAALLLGADPASTPAQVAQQLLDDATTGVVRGRRDTADRLLYVGSAAGTDDPRTAPAPVIVTSPAAGSGAGVVRGSSVPVGDPT